MGRTMGVTRKEEEKKDKIKLWKQGRKGRGNGQKDSRDKGTPNLRIRRTRMREGRN